MTTVLPMVLKLRRKHIRGKKNIRKMEGKKKEHKIGVPQGTFSYTADIGRDLVYSYNNLPKPRGHALSRFARREICGS